MTKRKYATLGSVSHGTMRAEDLIPEFLYTLGQLDKDAHDVIVEDYGDVVDADDMDTEQADCCLEALFNALDEYAPHHTATSGHMRETALTMAFGSAGNPWTTPYTKEQWPR